ncbi:hypothetical protein DSO57_1020349 [Entomophthora muscae]|uniref:Uncharacterized protein n=2 Tax=Entomophthora muscae TaxID=34485 RepID=A0ACC2TDS2_9FUNG|nr:hypothetical protein DSO57_1024233 [Entomophthora muscae]KAJ9080870.1 hypothetical protein DSO57_1020349 [Entomophthora muscae]
MLHLLKHRKEFEKKIPFVGNMIPMMVRESKNESLEDDGEESDDDDGNPLGFLKIFDIKRNKKNKPIDPRLLLRTLFTFGNSVINVNVKAISKVEGDSGIFAIIPPLRHALYANAVADGLANFLSGVIYACYTQSRDFCAEVQNGRLTKAEFLGALIGIVLQGGVYSFYGLFVFPTLFIKFVNINKHK